MKLLKIIIIFSLLLISIIFIGCQREYYNYEQSSWRYNNAHIMYCNGSTSYFTKGGNGGTIKIIHTNISRGGNTLDFINGDKI